MIRLGIVKQWASPSATMVPFPRPEYLNQEVTMAAVDGIGGVFFRPKDPGALGKWYAEHLGVLEVPFDH